MFRNVVPMIHVPNVGATAAWYTDIGFTVLATHPQAGYLDWAMLGFGDGRVMLNEGGLPSAAKRREVDLYVFTDNVTALADQLRGRVTMVEDVHETEYGMREVIIRDRNGFWITFGESLA